MSIETDYNVQVSGTCRKCAAGDRFDNFAGFVSLTFPGYPDKGLARPIGSGINVSGTPSISGSYDMACDASGDCWTDMSDSQMWTGGAEAYAAGTTGRVWARHDTFCASGTATLSGVSGATLSGMLTLPADYALTQAEIDKFEDNIHEHVNCDNYDMSIWSGTLGLSIVDSQLCAKILRNLWECPTYWNGEGAWHEYNAVDPEESDDFSYGGVMGVSGSGFIPWGDPIPTRSGELTIHILANGQWPIR
jgi:hypothetical protein